MDMVEMMNEEQEKAFKKLLRAYRHPEGQRCFFLDVSDDVLKTIM
jgi:hypothetical protein